MPAYPETSPDRGDQEDDRNYQLERFHSGDHGVMFPGSVGERPVERRLSLAGLGSSAQASTLDLHRATMTGPQR